MIHFCQGLKWHHILTQDKLDTSDTFDKVLNHITNVNKISLTLVNSVLFFWILHKTNVTNGNHIHQNPHQHPHHHLNLHPNQHQHPHHHLYLHQCFFFAFGLGTPCTLHNVYLNKNENVKYFDITPAVYAASLW